MLAETPIVKLSSLLGAGDGAGPGQGALAGVAGDALLLRVSPTFRAMRRVSVAASVRFGGDDQFRTLAGGRVLERALPGDFVPVVPNLWVLEHLESLRPGFFDCSHLDALSPRRNEVARLSARIFAFSVVDRCLGGALPSPCLRLLRHQLADAFGAALEAKVAGEVAADPLWSAAWRLNTASSGVTSALVDWASLREETDAETRGTYLILAHMHAAFGFNAPTSAQHEKLLGRLGLKPFSRLDAIFRAAFAEAFRERPAERLLTSDLVLGAAGASEAALDLTGACPIDACADDPALAESLRFLARFLGADPD